MTTQHRASEFTLSRSEVDRIANATASLRDKTLIELLFYGCLRVSEATRLDVRDVDLERLRLTIVGKGDKSRVVPLPESVVASLRFQIGKTVAGPVFPSRKMGSRGPQSMTTRQAARILAAAAKRAGVSSPNPLHQNVNPHLLRHSGSRFLLSSRVEPRIVQNVLGHSSVKTTIDCYGTPSEDEVANDVRAAWGG
jgi:integrase